MLTKEVFKSNILSINSSYDLLVFSTNWISIRSISQNRGQVRSFSLLLKIIGSVDIMDVANLTYFLMLIYSLTSY